MVDYFCKCFKQDNNIIQEEDLRAKGIAPQQYPNSSRQQSLSKILQMEDLTASGANGIKSAQTSMIVNPNYQSYQLTNRQSSLWKETSKISQVNQKITNEAIDFFMNSPRRRQTQEAEVQTPKNSEIATKATKKNKLAQSQKQHIQKSSSTICVSKSYKMLCAQCNRFFTKIMVMENNTSRDDLNPLSALDMHILFGAPTNHSCKCPFCNEIAIIILQTQMLVGDKFQLDYTKNNDFGKNTFGSQSNGTATYLDKADQMVFEESEQQTAPTTIVNLNGKSCNFLVQTLTQKLKHPNKYAKVYLVEEDCQLREKLLQLQQNNKSVTFNKQKNKPSESGQSQNLIASSHTVYKDTETFLPSQDVELSRNETSANEKLNINLKQQSPSSQLQKQQSQVSASSFSIFDLSVPLQQQLNLSDKKINPSQDQRILSYYPETIHCVMKGECDKNNSRVMKHIMKQKMQKNATFIQSPMVALAKKDQKNQLQASQNLITPKIVIKDPKDQANAANLAITNNGVDKAPTPEAVEKAAIEAAKNVLSMQGVI